LDLTSLIALYECSGINPRKNSRFDNLSRAAFLEGYSLAEAFWGTRDVEHGEENEELHSLYERILKR
jgi:hypothetical protein